MNRIDVFKRDLELKRAIKVIAGIDNFDINNVRKVLMAAQEGQASAVDVAYNYTIISLAKELTTLPVFVSSINPTELADAAELGADAIEIGNYDALYRQGVRISSEEVLDIVYETLKLLKNKIFISVTVPGHISVNEQISLVQKLDELGIDLVQTEGSPSSNSVHSGARGLLETSLITISNTMELVKNTTIPIMTSSGISTSTAPLAFAAGASAIGVGSCVNKLNSTIAMVAVVRTLVESTGKIIDKYGEQIFNI